MSIKENLTNLKLQIPGNVKLIVVSKTKSIKEITEVYDSGHKIFGENKVQELVEKHTQLPQDIEWHFIGHLQTNKVKQIAPFVNLIHGIDSMKLLFEVDKEAKKNNRIIDCLLQFHIATEDTKFGFNYYEVEELLSSMAYRESKNIRLTGVMGMATFTSDKDLIQKEFKELKRYFDNLKTSYFANSNHFKEISAGMSDDFQIAIEEGSTMVRIGTAIFGERNKS
ncbi:MAG: YggS family pyridoxal phosphate-dependent enzyme [Bacteroidales bacterium]|jgi:hypothetical protein